MSISQNAYNNLDISVITSKSKLTEIITEMTDYSSSFSQPFGSNISLFRNEFEQCVNGVNKLPENTLLQIFSYLSKQDLQNCQQVCQRWKQVSRNPSLWKTLEIQDLHTKQGLNIALRKIWMFQQIKRISIKNSTETPTLLRQICRCLPDLEFLTIRHCTELSSSTMKVVMKYCQKLRYLDLERTTFNDFSFYEDFANLKNLEVLNLNENGQVTTKNLIYIVLNCRNLKEIYTTLIEANSDKKFTDSDCYFLITNVAKKLKGLSVDATNLTDSSFQKIILNYQLEHLGFHRAYNLGGQTFSNIWQYLNHLRTLKITFGNQISNQNFETLFMNGKTEMSELEVIDFTGCWQIGNGGLKQICDSCTKLRKLIVEFCRNITDIACTKKCTTLELINIAFCPKVDLNNWFPIQDSIQSIYIDKSYNLEKISEWLKTHEKIIKLHVCASV